MRKFKVLLSISGLQLFTDYISPETENHLATYIDTQPWITNFRRRVQHYGYIYDYKRRTVDPSMYLGALPNWLETLAVRMAAEEVFPKQPDQCIVNEYEPGQGISPHIDCEPCFGDVIASLSLLSSCVMGFTHIETGAQQQVVLPPRSLLVMRGEARYLWKHGIPARQTDKIDGKTHKRGRRLSITCRSVVVTQGTS